MFIHPFQVKIGLDVIDLGNGDVKGLQFLLIRFGDIGSFQLASWEKLSVVIYKIVHIGCHSMPISV